MWSYIKNLSEHEGKEVTIKGWLYNKRSSGSIHFLQFRDGTGTIQGVAAKGEVSQEVFNTANELNIESSIEVNGIVKKDDRAPSGYELQITDITIVQLAPDVYPIAKRQKGEVHGIDFLLNNRHLHLREPKQIAIQKVRNEIIQGIYEFMEDNDFVKIDAPIFTPTSCEDSTELFKVPYTPAMEEGGEEVFVYLTQSGQLYIESAIFAHAKVYDFGPVFRAEKSKTRRHLNEFWMMDAEMAFFEHEDNMKVQEDLIVHLVKRCLTNCKNELEILGRDISKLENITSPFIHLEHKEAVKILQKAGSDIKDRDDLGADDETMLTEMYEKPIFIEKYPKEVKAFYMQKDPNDPTRVLNDDLLAPEGYGEIIGGSERMDSYEELKQAIIDAGFDLKDYDWYLDLRKYGSVKHSGFGIGLERIVRWVCGLKHIRTTIPYPRMINRINP